MADVDHKAIIASLTADQRAALLHRSDAQGLRHLAVHLGAIGIASALIVFQVPGWPVVMLVQGILLCFLFTILHETLHRTPFRTRWLNDLVGRLCGFFVLIGPHWFRHFHLAHHRYTNQPDLDPELASPRPSTVRAYLRYLSGLPEIVDRVRLLIRNAFRPNHDSYVPSHGKANVLREARIQVALYIGLIGVSVFTGSAILLFVWLIPLLLGGPFLRGYLLAEHAGAPHVESMMENTRTTFTTAVVRFIAWNMPYHAEHHAYPAVPFHKLPEFHQHTKRHLRCTEDGYVRFNRKYLAELAPKS